MLKSGRKPNPNAYTGAKIVKIVTKLSKVKIYLCDAHCYGLITANEKCYIISNITAKK